MKGVKNIFFAGLIFTCCNSSFAQSRLLDFYKALGFSRQGVTNDLRTSNYYPQKATDYIWNVSTWNFTDTTLYTYGAAGRVSSETKKDNTNNFISRILYSFDGSDNVTQELHQNWSSGWVNNTRDTFAFDNYNSLVLEEHQQWNTNQWMTAGGYRYFYTYNTGGKALTKLTVSWNTSTLAWDSVSRITNTYNPGNQVIQTIGESYNLSAWQLISKTDYTYDASFINTQTTDYNWNGTQWVNDTRLINIVWNTWTGDVNTSDPLNYVYQLWNGTSWDNYNRLTYTYDAFGGVIQLTELFTSGNWRNDSRLSEFYDNQYNYTGILSESWNTFTSAWDTSYDYKYIYTYDINYAILEKIYQVYDVVNHVFQNDSRAVYSDFILLGVKENLSFKNSAIKIYPDPVTDYSNVIAPEDMKGFFHYGIYDSTGRMVRVGEEKSNFRIQKEGLAEGLYLLRISDSRGVSHVLRFVVQ